MRRTCAAGVQLNNMTLIKMLFERGMVREIKGLIMLNKWYHSICLIKHPEDCFGPEWYSGAIEDTSIEASAYTMRELLASLNAQVIEQYGEDDARIFDR